jgi:hypothetical protein
MSLPLYGFLEGDTVGLLIVADQNESISSLARKLQEAGNIRVKPKSEANWSIKGRLLTRHLRFQEQVSPLSNDLT